MDTIALAGYLAGTLTTISFVPQVIRTWKLKETKDFSLAMLLLFAAGMLLWTVYGIWINSFPIIAANIITLCSRPVLTLDENKIPLIYLSFCTLVVIRCIRKIHKKRDYYSCRSTRQPAILSWSP